MITRKLIAAYQLGIPVIKRAEMLARLFNERVGIAVGGTSGKSTVTAMAGHILAYTKKRPTIINGGIMLNFVTPKLLGNAVFGTTGPFVIEADESDGTIEYYEPDIAVVNNISRDHKCLDELYGLFSTFLNKAKNVGIVNVNCIQALQSRLRKNHLLTFGQQGSEADIVAHSICFELDGTRFSIDDVKFRLQLLGQHNLMNAVAATAACLSAGISLPKCSAALKEFLGVSRRLQKIGEVKGISIVDDFAHNPDKIKATLMTLKPRANRLLVMFQPHGFAPTRFAKTGLINVFTKILDAKDLLLMPEIYYAGGTAEKSISSKDLIGPIANLGIDARFVPSRSDIAQMIIKSVKSGDIIVIMGARDDTLTDFAIDILKDLEEIK